MKINFIFFGILTLLTLSIRQHINAQVSLAPTALFINDQTNVTSLYVTNRSEVAQEISISYEFGYPASDDSGNMVTIYNDSVKAERYGLDRNLRAFPRQFVLQPGQQQTIRLQVRPVQNKPDGMYWTRVIVTSSAAVQDIETVQITEGVGTQINYVFKQNIAAFYRKGKVSTGLKVGNVNTVIKEGKLITVSQLFPSGNSPYNGSVTARLLNNAGKELATHQQTVVAYFDVLRNLEINLPEGGLPSGNYTLEFTYETKRNDIAPSDLVQAEPVKHKVDFSVP